MEFPDLTEINSRFLIGKVYCVKDAIRRLKRYVLLVEEHIIVHDVRKDKLYFDVKNKVNK
jgi:hypothetical protein